MRHPPQFPPEYARGTTCVHSRRALLCARHHYSWFGIHQVLDRQPEAPAVAKEPQGKHDEKWHPDRELPPAGQIEPGPQHEEAADRDHRAHGVVDVDGPDEVALSSLE